MLPCGKPETTTTLSSGCLERTTRNTSNPSTSGMLKSQVEHHQIELLLFESCQCLFSRFAFSEAWATESHYSVLKTPVQHRRSDFRPCCRTQSGWTFCAVWPATFHPTIQPLYNDCLTRCPVRLPRK